MNVAIIDYQMGNLFSVKRACDKIGLNSEITSNKENILNSDTVILPGVGAFSRAMNNLNRLKLVEPIKAFVKSGKPFMGICLGLHLLFSESEEFGTCKGLDLIDGNVVRFKNTSENGTKIHVPHVGWNKIKQSNFTLGTNTKNPFINDWQVEYLYFVHSFYAVPKEAKIISTTTNYAGIEFCSSVLIDNIFATQFHPEKSGPLGLDILANWFGN